MGRGLIKCSICDVMTWKRRDHKSQKGTMQTRPAECNSCFGALCEYCMRSKNPSDASSAIKWCPMCWARQPHCEVCDLTISRRAENNLFVCRNKEINGFDCNNLICKPCGDREGGCKIHSTGATGREFLPNPNRD